MLNALALIAQATLSVGLFWSSFCRLEKTDHTTVREVRLAIWFEGVVALGLLGAPVLPLLVPECDWPAWTTPTALWLTLLLAAVLRVASSARHWRHGVPVDFVETQR